MSKVFNNFKDFEKALKDSINAINGQVSFSELFNESFMRKYTNFSSFEELLSAGGFVVNSQKDFEAIPDDIFDKHVAKTTKFKSWEEMLAKAAEIYAANKLKF